MRLKEEFPAGKLSIWKLEKWDEHEGLSSVPCLKSTLVISGHIHQVISVLEGNKQILGPTWPTSQPSLLQEFRVSEKVWKSGEGRCLRNDTLRCIYLHMHTRIGKHLRGATFWYLSYMITPWQLTASFLWALLVPVNLIHSLEQNLEVSH